jgi:hypothetical protein
MTEQQLKDYHSYGCMSKAVRKLAERRGNSLTLEQYCVRFEKLFYPQYGALTTSGLFEVARELKLCSRAWTFVSTDTARQHVKSQGLFVITERYWIGDIRWIPATHVRLVLACDASVWVLWNEDRDGREEKVLETDLLRQLPHFIMLG